MCNAKYLFPFPLIQNIFGIPPPATCFLLSFLSYETADIGGSPQRGWVQAAGAQRRLAASLRITYPLTASPALGFFQNISANC